MNEISLMSRVDFFIPVLVIMGIIVLYEYMIKPNIIQYAWTRYFYLALTFRIIACFCSLIFYSYTDVGYSDTYNYFTFAKGISNVFRNCNLIDGFKVFYVDYDDLSLTVKSFLSNQENLIAIYSNNKFFVFLTGLVSFVTFDSYLSISLIYTFLGFIGNWLIFHTLCKLFPTLKNYFLFFILLYPPFIFWSSGVVKESLSICCIGILFYLIFNNNFTINMWRKIVLGSISVFVLYNVKSYLLFTFLFALVIVLFLIFIRSFQNKYVRLIVFCLFMAVFFIFIYYDFATFFLSEIFQSIFNQILIISNSQLQAGGSSYDLGTINSDFGGILRYLVASVNVSLFRPYLWEVDKPQLLLSAIDSLFISGLFMSFIFLKWSVGRIKEILKNKLLIFSFVFIIAIACQIGAISFNFGTLLRYKTPIYPFLFSFFLIIYQERLKKMELLINCWYKKIIL